ncbi:protein sld2 [Aspergillus lucknowensis]|uniref:DNA replication regulator SLD2 n=1 Tax=Aspergillus lucknowensis TaxID=176173 RepID=A0ABR4LMX0_9EURO
MTTVAVSETATHAATLRAELKEWEREFAAANGGRKAGRNDIKQVPEIAAKYKEYSRLKEQDQETSTSKTKKAHSKPSAAEDERSKKRKRSSPNGPDQSYAHAHTHTHTHTQTSFTPRKSKKGVFQTPSKTRTTYPSDVDPYDSPSVLRRLFSPSTHMHSSSPLKTAIGPTPQRDGKALGLFDLLSESGGSTATPSATRIASVKGMAAQTPSKKRRTMDTIAEEGEDAEAGVEAEEEESRRAGRTPVSSAKKYMLSALFATPTTLRYSAMVEGDNNDTSRGSLGNLNPAGTDQSPAKPAQNPGTANLETPSFLRRSTSGLYSSSQGAGAGGGLSPIPARKAPQFVGKGLSQLVQGLRDMEEERIDEEWDILREIEIEQEGLNVDVPDSQMPAEQTGRTYKKKGQKRTTRLVRMKPVVSAKPSQRTGPQSQSQSQSQPQLRAGPLFKGNIEDLEETENEDELEAIPETQANATAGNPVDDGGGEGDLDSLHSISEAEPEDSDSDPDYDGDSKPPARSKSFSEKMKEAIGDTKPHTKDPLERAKQRQKQEKESSDGKENKKPSARKVNPQAHANYRSLKIRNRGGRGRNFGRFRRR